MCSSSGANSLEVEKLDTTLLFVWVLIVVRYKYTSKRQFTSGFDLTVTSNCACLDRQSLQITVVWIELLSLLSH